jgi:hypothetical protein
MPISTAEHKTFFERLSKDRQQNANVLEKRSMRGVKQRVIDKYSDNTHFIDELIQNADDVKATQARFVLTESSLVFAHNGTIHFSITDPETEEIDTKNNRLGHINAITSIGNSNKYEAQIGKFGVGFKAIFQYTQTPEIYDFPFFFKIERFIVPIWLANDHPDRQADETLFYFPFDNPQQSPIQAYHAILNKLQHLTHPLLFLQYLTEITWMSKDGKKGQYTKVIRELRRKIPPFSKGGTPHDKTISKLKFGLQPEKRNPNFNLDEMAHFFPEIALISISTTINTSSDFQNSLHPSQHQHFLIFSRKINCHSVSIAYLVRLSEQGQAIQILSHAIFPAYCFFPTKETTHLHFLVQAPFLLTDNREGIKQSATWNQQLIAVLASLTADSLSIIKTLGLLTADFFLVLPITAADFATESLFKPIYEAVLTRLQSSEALLPTQLGDYTTQDNAYLAEQPALIQLVSTEQLQQILKHPKAQWVFPKTTPEQKTLWDYLKHHVKIPEITTDKLIRRLTIKFLQVQTDAWLMLFYSYLLENVRDLWKSKPALLQTKPILRLTNGQMVSMYNRAGKIQVYLPTNEESEYPTLKKCFGTDAKAQQFFHLLGLDKPKIYEEIQYYILPRYQEGRELEPAIRHRDFRKLLTYFLNCPWNQKTEYLNKLKQIPFLLGKCQAEKSAKLMVPTRLYLPTDALQDYFRTYQNIYFLAQNCYAPVYSEFGEQVLNQFFQAVGVENKPRRIKINASLSVQQRQAIHNGRCTHDYYHISQHTYDYDLEGLHTSLNSINIKKSKQIWDFCCQLIAANPGQDIFTGQYNWFYRREKYHHFAAKWLITLQQTAWLYNVQTENVKPVDLTVSELTTHYETQSESAKIFIEKLQIPLTKLSGFSAEQKQKYAFGAELFQLAKTSGKEPTEIFRKFKDFLAQNGPKNQASHLQLKESKLGNTSQTSAQISLEKEEPKNQASHLQLKEPKLSNTSQGSAQIFSEKESDSLLNLDRSIESTDFSANEPKLETVAEDAEEAQKPNKRSQFAQKREQLQQQFQQQINELTKIETLQARVYGSKKYSFAWFKNLLELEALLSYQNQHDHQTLKLKFNQVESESSSAQILILKNPTGYIPPNLEDTANLSLQLQLSHKTKSVLVEVVRINPLNLWVRLQFSADIQTLDLSKVQTAVLEINNPTFLLDKLKTNFRQLPYADEYDLQNLPKNITFILGPPGTGKTTYLVTEKILPLMKTAKNLKVLVLTPTNKVADVLVTKMMAEISKIPLETHENEKAEISPNLSLSKEKINQIKSEWLIRFGATGESEIEKAGFLKDNSFDLTQLNQCVVVTTLVRFLYDGFQNNKLKDYQWDAILFDEASMMMLAQIVYVLYQQPNCRFIIVGDPFQIQPMVVAKPWHAENIYTLIGFKDFQVPQTSDFPMTYLTTQYRSIPPLGTLVSQLTYNGILTHHRQLNDKKPLHPKDINLTEITLIKFPVNSAHKLYASQRLEKGGTYHLYSAILTVELASYLATQIIKQSQSGWKIGIICPYLTQATLVEKIMTLFLPTNAQIQIVIGTVHSFQGDEFDLVFVLLNPPPLLSSNIFLNNQNILNVALSRAKDYLILLMPDIKGLTKLTRLETILEKKDLKPYIQKWTASEIEQLLFKKDHYIAENTSITTHQTINIYGKPTQKYNVLIDENTIDIQVNFK